MCNFYNYYNIYPYPYSKIATLFMLLMATTFFICTLILLLSCIFSLSTGGLISKTLYVRIKFWFSIVAENLKELYWNHFFFFFAISQEFIYHLFAAILLFIASVWAFVKITDSHREFEWYWNITVSMKSRKEIYFSRFNVDFTTRILVFNTFTGHLLRQFRLVFDQYRVGVPWISLLKSSMVWWVIMTLSFYKKNINLLQFINMNLLSFVL